MTQWYYFIFVVGHENYVIFVKYRLGADILLYQKTEIQIFCDEI